jgi:hypothetical protein
VTTADDYEVIRDWCGTDCDDLIPDALARNSNDPERAALSILRRRLAGLGVDQFAVAGDYSQNGSAERAWIVRQIGRLERLTGDVAAGVDVPAVAVGRLCRPDTDR